MLRATVKHVLRKIGYELVNVSPVPGVNVPKLPSGDPIPDHAFYKPLFSPWDGYGPFADYFTRAAPHTLVSADRCWILYCLATQSINTLGDFIECGVYKGGTASMLASLLGDSPQQHGKKLHLFDTFSGMPETDPTRDLHVRGDFGDTSLDSVKSRVGHSELVVFHSGTIPDTFSEMSSVKIAFAHVDVDIYESVMNSCSLIMPRLSIGGFLVFDDYGFPSCPGAREAVDEYFAQTPYVPLILPTGQAVIFKSIE